MNTLQTTAVYHKIALAIIKRQEKIIGPVFWILAGKVQGITINNTARPTDIDINAEPKAVINGLVAQCDFLFGLLGQLECKDATEEFTALLNPADVPDSLK